MPVSVGKGPLNQGLIRNPKIRIHVRVIGNNKTTHQFSVVMRGRRSLDALRNEIKHRTGINESNQVILFKGRELKQRHVALLKYGMYDGCTVECVFAVHA